MLLKRGWKSFALTLVLKEGHVLHFKFDGVAMLFMKIFGEAGNRLGCCMDSDRSGGGSSFSGNDSSNSSSGGSASDNDCNDSSGVHVKKADSN
ncbi:hypothetical protein D1007_32414 [Hordeum vulgare]|nr:hypothetical protein D1007_32414 [Hordeum vulgare]